MTIEERMAVARQQIANPKAGSMLDKARKLDAEIAAAGGLAAHFVRENTRLRPEGKPHYTRLIDPVTERVIAELANG